MFYSRLWGFLTTLIAIFTFSVEGTVAQPDPLVLNVACDNSALAAAFTTANTTEGDEIINLAAGCTYTPAATLELHPDGADGTVTINGNGATLNGGNAIRLIRIFSGATASIDYLTLTNAQVYDAGGGAILNEGTLTLTNSIVSNNGASQGAGILNQGTLTVDRVAFVGNMVGGMGFSATGIYNAGSATILNSTFSGNEYQAIRAGGTMTHIRYSTIVNNENGVGRVAAVDIVIENTVISQNSVSNCTGPSNATITALYADDNSCDGTVVTTEALNLGTLAHNGGFTQTHALLHGSVLIDAAVGDCPPTDQRGVERPSGVACDVGAFEFVHSLPDAAPLLNMYDSPVFVLTWSNVSWAVGYHIQVDDNADFSSPNFNRDDLPIGALSVPVDSLPNGFYYWRVRAQRANGTWSEWSAVDTFVVQVM